MGRREGMRRRELRGDKPDLTVIVRVVCSPFERLEGGMEKETWKEGGREGEGVVNSEGGSLVSVCALGSHKYDSLCISGLPT